ncbi:MAG: hypothetical protein HQ518_05540 [Rhodopirellula sp.]|nr:hypothetical protein [Rhodopirellula sp.]
MFQQTLRSAAQPAALILLMTFFSLGHSAFAQDENATVGTAVTEQVVKNPAKAADDSARHAIADQDAEKEQRRKSALAGLLVLSLICIVFLVLIVLVALWARRIRMLTHQPLPEQHPGDPLWYLRNGKGSDVSDIASLTEGSSSHDEASQ